MSTILQADQRLASGQAKQAGVVWQRFRKQRTGLLGLIVLLLMIVGVLIIPIISPFDAHGISPLSRFAPMGASDAFNGQTHWLGTDYLGRDEMVRLFTGGRVSLLIALAATVFIVLIGTIVGAISGYYGGLIDTALMRFTDFMLAIPLLPMYLFTMRLLREAPALMPIWFDDKTNALLTLAAVAGVFTLFGWMALARLVRGSVLTLRSLDFVEAARARGQQSPHYIQAPASQHDCAYYSGSHFCRGRFRHPGSGAGLLPARRHRQAVPVVG